MNAESWEDRLDVPRLRETGERVKAWLDWVNEGCLAGDEAINRTLSNFISLFLTDIRGKGQRAEFFDLPLEEQQHLLFVARGVLALTRMHAQDAVNRALALAEDEGFPAARKRWGIDYE
jgi:hypothetical protein